MKRFLFFIIKLIFVMNRPDPAMTFFDGLFLSHFRKKNLKFKHDFVIGCRLVSNYELKNLLGFENKTFLVEPVLAQFSHISAHSSRTANTSRIPFVTNYIRITTVFI